MIDGHEINTKKTASTTPIAVMALGALSLMTAYMSAMSFFNPSNTVFKSQFDIKGDQFNGIMLLVAVLSFAAFMLSKMTLEEKHEKKSVTIPTAKPVITRYSSKSVSSQPINTSSNANANVNADAIVNDNVNADAIVNANNNNNSNKKSAFTQGHVISFEQMRNKGNR